MENTTAPRELHGIKLFGYSIGFFGVMLSNMLGGVFVLQFYAYTINLNSFWVSIAQFIQLFISAFASIIFGVIIDNKRPIKIGKRRPFLLYGLPIWIISCILIWYPPFFIGQTDKSNEFLLTLYLTTFLVLKAVSGTSMLVAHASMFPEQTQTLKNRSKVATINSILIIVASIVGLLMPLIVQSMVDNPLEVAWWQPSSAPILTFIPLIGIAFAIAGAITVLITFFAIDESFHSDSRNKEFVKKSIKETFSHMQDPIKDKKYRKFMFTGFFNQFSGKIIGIAVFPFITYVLLFTDAQFFIYIIISITCKFGWFAVWKLIGSKFHNYVRIYSWTLIIAIIASFLELLFLFQIPNFSVKVALFAVSYGTILGSMYVFNLFGPPISAALVDEAANNRGNPDRLQVLAEISGSYSGALSFTTTIGAAFASIFVGVFLFGNNKTNPTILTICFATTGIFYLLALLSMRRIKLIKQE